MNEAALDRLRLSGSEKLTLGQCLFLSCLMAVLVLTVPVFMLQLYDRILPSGNTDTLWVLTAIALAMLLLFGMFDSLRSRLLQRLGAGLELRALERAPVAAIAGGDLDRLRLATQSGAPAALLDLPGLPVFLVVLAILHPWFAAFAALMSVMLIVVSLMGGIRVWGASPIEALDRVLDGSERQWLSPLQATALDRIGQRRAAQRLSELPGLDRRSRVTAVLKSLRLAAQIGCLAVGGYLAIIGEISPAVIVAATIVMSRALAPIEQLAGGWPVLLEAWRGWQRLRDLPAEEAFQGSMPVDDAPEIFLEQAAITQPNSDRPILRNLDLRLRPGTILGIVGTASTGKTALLQAIAGAWPLRLGRIIVGGRDPRGLNSVEHRETFGIVEQTPTLVAGTVAENIAGFSPDADARAILEAARAAGIHEALLAQSDGYGREVGPAGKHLSAAMRFGVALAAALYHKPKILLLDAPFSHLDMAATKRLNACLQGWINDQRLIVITANRLEDLQYASHLVVLGEGRLQAGGAQSDVIAWLHARQAPQQTILASKAANQVANQDGRSSR